MIKALALALLLFAPSCKFAVKQPAATAGIVAGTIVFGSCELASSQHGQCAIAAGAAGAVLFLITAGALWLGTEDEAPAPVIDNSPPPIAAAPDPGPAPRPPVSTTPPAPSPPTVIPDHLKQPPELFARDGVNIVRAPDADHAVAASYAASPVRGPITNGQRITILTASTKYKLGDEVRVIHVLEAPEPGHSLMVMGPKPIYGEYVDGVERTPKDPGAQPYDGRVLQSPGVDFNYEVTVYKLDTVGPHRIQWRTGGRASNVLEIEVVQ